MIFGTGAVACLLGGRLARDPRNRVTLAGTWSDALERITRDGIEVTEPGTAWTSHPAAVPVVGLLPVHDVALVLVKTWQTASVALHVARECDTQTPVFTLQNGLGSAQILSRALGREVGVGVARLGALLVGPGRVRSTGAGDVALAGQGAEDLAIVLTTSGTPAREVSDVDVHVWRKLVGNVAVNALTALHRVPNGALLERAELRADFEAAAREAGAVARARGIDIGAEPVALARALVAATAANRSSMLQDVERGAPTEVDAINGAISNAGRELGVPTPVNDALWHAVHQLHPAAAVGVA